MPSSQRLHARCAGAGAAAPFTIAGTERQYERSRPFAITHAVLDLGLDFKKKAVDGTATLHFERVAAEATELRLDAVGFELHQVRLDAGTGWTAAEYDYDGDLIVIEIPAAARAGKVEVAYRARPRRGLYFLGPDRKVKDRPQQVWSQCQDEDARHFFPCHDKPHVKMTTELRVRVPAGFVALSNGELVEQHRPRKNGKPWVYHFKMDRPHSSYLVTLVAGRFQVLEDRPAERGENLPPVPVVYYLPPGRAEDGLRAFRETPRMIELFGRLTGVPYPWSRYSQVVVSDFIFGGMENTTATTMYEHVLLDKKAAVDVTSNDLVAHELAHQWFGDYVTCRDWSHAWLNEGFATFFEHVEREDRLGRDEYDNGIAGDIDAYLAEASGRYQRPIVCRDYQNPIDLFDRHLYEKGGLVLHMLRRELGDETFWRGINRYLLRQAGGIVETNDLMRALEDVSGRSLDRFFDQWVYRPGHPVFKVKIGWEDGLLSVHAKQTQKTGQTAVFAYELEIEVMSKDGTLTCHRKSVSLAADTFVLRLGDRPAWVAFDPNLRILGDVTVEGPADMLRRQLDGGSSARVRWAAADALGRRDDPPSIEALAKALAKKDEAWMVRAEAARALGKIRSDDSRQALERQIRVRHPKVRRAVVAALGNFKEARTAQLLGGIAGRDGSYLVEAEAARALGRTRQGPALKSLLGVLDRRSWADVVRAGALDGLASLRDEAAVDAVIECTRYGIPTRARRAAVAALARLSDSRKVREHLEDLLDDGDPHLRIDVINALQALGEPRARSGLRRRLERELDGRVVRRLREALRDLGDAHAGERHRVNDDLESLKGELNELKARLGRLEDKRKHHGKNGAAKSELAAATKRKRPRLAARRAKRRAPAKSKR